jgi:ERCC4-type nuclease
LISSIRSERLPGHQLPGLQRTYDFRWLLIEGLWRSTRKGLLQVEHRGRWQDVQGRMTVSELNKRVLVMLLRGGLIPWYTTTRHQTLEWVRDLYRTWTDVALDQHQSHLAIYEPPTLCPVTQFRRTVKTLPDVGLKASLAAQQTFGSLKHAINAGIAEWASVTTMDDHTRKKRRLGMKVATRIVNAINHVHPGQHEEEQDEY